MELTEEEKYILKKYFYYKEMTLFNYQIEELEEAITHNKKDNELYEEFNEYLKLKNHNSNIYRNFLSIYDDKFYYLKNIDDSEKRDIEHEELKNERIFKAINQMFNILNIDKQKLLQNKKIVIQDFIKKLEQEKNNLDLFSNEYINFEKEDFFNKKTKDDKVCYKLLLLHINKFLFNYGHTIIYSQTRNRVKGSNKRTSEAKYIIISNIFLKKITERKIIMNEIMKKNNKDTVYIFNTNFFDTIDKKEEEITDIQQKINNMLYGEDIYEVFGINRPKNNHI